MLWCFVTLSFLGWVFNMIHSFISEKKIYNKGFLTLPFCPSYGAGGVICYYVFHNLADNIFITFIGSALVLSVLTVICGALLNKILGCKPWDYSGMRFNIGTYLTLPNAMMLGLLGVFTVHMLVPPLNLLLNMIPDSLSLILVLIFCGMILIDFIFSLITIIRLRKRIKHLGNEAELLGVRIDNVMAGATSGLKFKSEFPQAATDTLLAQAVAKVKAMSPEFIDDGKGGKRLVFKGADGEIQRNPENHLEPFTAEELVRRELRQMGILDEGRQQPGTGTTPPKKQQGGTSGAPVDVSMARTQNEAQEIIAQSLMKQGMVNGSKEFQAAMDAAWQENNISALPMS